MRRVLQVCGGDRYANIADFHWFVGVLVFLTATLQGSQAQGSQGQGSRGQGGGDPTEGCEEEIAACVMDIALRVTEIRGVLVRAMLGMMGGGSGSGSGSGSPITSAPVSIYDMSVAFV